MVQSFVNLMFRHDQLQWLYSLKHVLVYFPWESPIVNKPTRVTWKTATAIDHIITDSVINTEFKTGIIKTDLFNHFPIFFIFKCVVDSTEAREKFIYKRNYSGNSIETSKQKLREVNWNEVKTLTMQTNLRLNFPIFLLLFMKNVFLSSKLDS